MTLAATISQAHALDGREAGLQVAHQALNSLGSVSPSFGFVFTPYRYDASQIMNGITSLVGNVPIIGMSTSATIDRTGLETNSVTLALVGGSDIRAEAHWFPNYSQSSQDTAVRITQLFNYEQQIPTRSLIVFGDGFNGDPEIFCENLSAQMPLFGALANGDLNAGTTHQISGSQSSTGSLAATILRGNIRMGVGHGHGWRPVGNRFRVTRARGYWLRTLDGRPASEAYAQLFGFPARDWAFPPLNTLTRIYPLGLEKGSAADLLLRSPMRIEADGSFRMNVSIHDGTDAYLLIGSPDACQKAAAQAAQNALIDLGDAKPALAVVLVDAGWQMLLQSRAGMEIESVQKVIGDKVPVIGAYTLGQFIPAGESDQHPRFLNQHIAVALFGEPEA
jgi:hypothetical protein